MLGAILGVSGGIRVYQGCIGVASGLKAQPHWAPVQGPSSPTGSPGGVTYLAKAKQVREMSSAGYYIDLELYFVKVFTFVSMQPHHIFLHAIFRNVIWDYFLCRPIYAYPYTINLMYYSTLVVIANNYFSHQISELVHVPWVYVQSSICDIDLV